MGISVGDSRVFTAGSSQIVTAHWRDPVAGAGGVPGVRPVPPGRTADLGRIWAKHHPRATIRRQRSARGSRTNSVPGLPPDTDWPSAPWIYPTSATIWL